MASIYEAEWEDLLPEELKQDKRIVALITAIAEQKRKIAQEIWRARPWPDFQGINEDMMEILRQDLDISEYEFQGTAEDKQRILQKARGLHRNAGTVSAVKDAIATVYPDGNGDVLEWFDYGGNPYYFQPIIDVTGADVDDDKLQTVLARINAAKNVRSWIDRVKLVTSGSVAGSIYTGGIIQRQRDATIGGIDGTVSDFGALIDENYTLLTDENGYILYEI